jgi:hypothetical protein
VSQVQAAFQTVVFQKEYGLMVSRPTHKPIPIPLSVPVEDCESFDSVDDLLASIRELVSPGAVDIIDLNRPVQSDLDHADPVQLLPAQMGVNMGVNPEQMNQGSGQFRGLAPCITTPGPSQPVYFGKTEAVSSESVSSESVTPHIEEKRYLSEKTRSESAKVLSSLMSALEGPDAHDSSTQGVHHSGYRDDGRMKGICVEDLVAQCLKAPLDQWISQNDGVISHHVKTIIDQHISELLHQWLDAHLPALIKVFVDQHLDALIQSVRKP